ncbi:hypothetical protein M8C21_007825, partial [Ambrosia artemisiifolia]
IVCKTQFITRGFKREEDIYYSINDLVIKAAALALRSIVFKHDSVPCHHKSTLGCILAVGFAKKWVIPCSAAGEFMFVSDMSVTLSCDHRIIDGCT